MWDDFVKKKVTNPRVFEKIHGFISMKVSGEVAWIAKLSICIRSNCKKKQKFKTSHQTIYTTANMANSKCK